MAKETTIKLQDGVLKLRKPKAGVRNKALMKSEDGSGIKQTTFLVELIPYCVAEHPWGTTPVRQALDNLDIDEYDKIIDEMSEMFLGDADDRKKSKELSGENDTQQNPGSETSQ